MESLSLEEENIIKDIRNLFRLKQKDIRNLFRLEKETKAIKARTLKDIENLLKNEEEEEESYYKPVVRVNTFWSNSWIDFDNNNDRNKTLSVEEYLDKN